MDVVDGATSGVHDLALLVHRDVVNVRRCRVNRLGWPDVATKLIAAVQRRQLHYLAVRLCPTRKRPDTLRCIAVPHPGA